jgi:hypothetical protein
MAQVCEILQGDVDGINVEYESSRIPEWGSLRVFVNGVEAVIESFSETTITLAAAPEGGTVFAVYHVKTHEPTALDLISDALMEIGVQGSDDQTPDICDAQLALRYLNRLIETSNITPGSIYTIRKDIFTLTPQKQDYTIGVDPAGIIVPDFQAPRPNRIESIVLQLQSVPGIVRDAPMVSLTDAEWANQRITAVYAIPKEYHYEPSHPLGAISFFPAPSSAYVIEMRTWHQVEQIRDLHEPLLLPPGYGDFWLYQLAIRLCGPFGRPISQQLMEMERRSVAVVTAMNVHPPRLGSDPAIAGRGCFNWMTGSVG